VESKNHVKFDQVANEAAERSRPTPEKLIRLRFRCGAMSRL
jgi:hypothetical protein